MLEARHLFKTYKTKKGVTTKALDDVSVTFAEKGMVFILGKSGSGKSTLLNVCGGLDKLDRGEIIIKGRSSADKGDFDFDSYRNTFVGFVFQEYNILEEFTVEENVALALELQHKKRDKEVINKILADVEMTDFAARKPNTLSGGQKQRVAIARALVKNPEIIMADEPTGALDSNTGKQVFDTLKKLSKDKLVLVVSHDREFAEQYGDRIIELKDGKIISDMTRAEDETADDKNVRFVGTDTVCVQSGAELTEEDFQNIKAFLSKSKGQAVITASRDKVDTITRDLRGGEFADTSEQPAVREYSQAEKKMIRSRLPMRHAIKMGASSLKSKPVRLVFTIFLSVISFLLFGVFSTLMLYDANQVTTNAFMESDYDYITFAKKYNITYESYHNGELDYTSVWDRDTAFTPAELQEWQQKYPNAIASVYLGYGGVQISNVEIGSNAQRFYGNSVEQVLQDAQGLQVLAGKRPAANDEIMISDFMFNAFKVGKMTDIVEDNGHFVAGDEITLSNQESIVGKKLQLRGAMGDGNESAIYKIVGVFKGAAVPSGYSEMKTAADNNNAYGGESAYTWENEREAGLYAAIAVTAEKFATLQTSSGQNDNRENLREKYFNEGYASVELQYNEPNGEPRQVGWIDSMAKLSGDKEKLTVYKTDGTALTSLSSGQLALSMGQYGNYWEQVLYQAIEGMQEDHYEVYEEYHWGKYVLDSENNPISVIGYTDSYGEFVEAECTNPEHWNGSPAFVPHNCDQHDNNYLTQSEKRTPSIQSYFRVFNNGKSAQEQLTALQKINAFISENSINVQFVPVYAENRNTNQSRQVTIAGIFFDESQNNELGNSAYVSDDLFASFNYSGNSANEWTSKETTKYVMPKDAFIGTIFIPYDHSESLTESLVKLSGEVQEDDSFAVISNSLMESLDMVNGMVELLSTVFMWVGIVLAAFSFLLMFNFISTSIATKKKEIGILRAIGSRTFDVFKIFLAEAAIIALICFVIATVGSFGVCYLLNNLMMSESPMFATGLLVFGPVSVLIIAAIAIAVSVIATVIPVALYSRKPPVASIRAL